MAKQQKYGIKFPINVSEEEMTLFGLNYSKAEDIKSQLMHLIFTPKGQRLRNPSFGTRLIQYIFNPNDSDTWGDIITEIRECVKLWIPQCDIQNIEVVELEGGLTLAAKINYAVTENNQTVNYEIITKL